jgi:hypothetical protein
MVEGPVVDDGDRCVARVGGGPRIEKPGRDQRPAGVGRRQQVLLARPADEIQDDVHAGSSGQAVGGVGDLLTIGGYHLGGAGGEQFRGPRARAGHGDGHRADLVRDLHRRPPHATRGAGDENPIGGAHSRHLDERVVGGEVRDPERRRLRDVESGRPADDRACRDRELFGVTAPDDRVRDGRDHDRVP